MTHYKLRNTITLFLITLSILLYSSSYSQERIVFTPQWTAQSQFAGYYVASALGFYKESGLDVVIRHPSASNNILDHLTNGSCDAINLNLITAMKAIGNGIPLVNILQTSQNNTLMVVSRDSIKSFEDLENKRVGTWKAEGFDAIPKYLANKSNCNIYWVNFISNINLYISKAIDATLAMSYSEFFQILSTGTNISQANILYFSDLGYNIPEDGIYVSAEFYKNNKEAAIKFAEASKRGWIWAAEHPEESLNIVLEETKKCDIKTNRELQKWMLEKILQAQIDKTSGKRTFELKSECVDQVNKILLEENAIKEKITLKQITEP